MENFLQQYEGTTVDYQLSNEQEVIETALGFCAYGHYQSAAENALRRMIEYIGHLENRIKALQIAPPHSSPANIPEHRRRRQHLIEWLQHPSNTDRTAGVFYRIGFETLSLRIIYERITALLLEMDLLEKANAGLERDNDDLHRTLRTAGDEQTERLRTIAELQERSDAQVSDIKQKNEEILALKQDNSQIGVALRVTRANNDRQKEEITRLRAEIGELRGASTIPVEAIVEGITDAEVDLLRKTIMLAGTTIDDTHMLLGCILRLVCERLQENK